MALPNLGQGLFTDEIYNLENGLLQRGKDDPVGQDLDPKLLGTGLFLQPFKCPNYLHL